MAKTKLSDRDQLIERLTARIKFKKKNLSETKKFHREVESELTHKITLDQMQLNALKRTAK